MYPLFFYSNSNICLEPDHGMPIHQAQKYFKQLINGLVNHLCFDFFFGIKVGLVVSQVKNIPLYII